MDIQNHFRVVDQPQLHHFRNADFGKFFLGHVPEFIPFVYEIFQADPDRVLQILDHIRGPVVVNLEAP